MLLRVIKEIPVEDGREVPIGELAVVEDPTLKEEEDVKIHVEFDDEVETYPDLTIDKQDFNNYFTIIMLDSEIQKLNRIREMF